MELRIFFNFLFVLALLGRTRVAFCLRLIFTHHWDKTGLGWTPGVGDGQGGLVCCGLWDCKESDKTEQLNWIEIKPFWVILMSREQGFSLSLSVFISLNFLSLSLSSSLSLFSLQGTGMFPGLILILRIVTSNHFEVLFLTTS